MNILIDIGHPAHIHYFRNMANSFIKRGYKVLFTAREKEVTIQLLDHYGFDYVSFGKPFKSRPGKVWGLFRFTFRVLITALKFKPDIYLNASMYNAIVAWLLRKPHISLEDTFNMEQVRLYRPFTSVILTGDYDHPDLGKKEIQYSGYQELLYLHPNRFTPNRSILKTLGVNENEKYVVLRFVSWNASHDFGNTGLSSDQKLELVKELEKHSKVFISSEAPLPDEFKEYQLKSEPFFIHDVLAFALLYIGEGATMASECAMMGTPAIYVNQQDAYTIREQENKYGLVFSYRSYDGVLAKALELINTEGSKSEFYSLRDRMFSEKIDVTAFLVWFMENYPESAEIMRNNPDYQERFK